MRGVLPEVLPCRNPAGSKALQCVAMEMVHVPLLEFEWADAEM